MAEITAALVKSLREKTGAGMMDCKKALAENDGEMEAAVDWLRAKGLSKAAKKAGRTAAEGLVGVITDGGRGAIVEVNAETDFVARNELFQQAVTAISKIALEKNGDLEAVLTAPAPDGDGAVKDMLVNLVAKIGENMALRRTASIDVSEGAVAPYIHNAAGEGIGKIGVLVALESKADQAALLEIGRKVAMHVAAARPLAATTADLDPEVVEKERAILTEQAKESGKPDNVIEKMVEGRIRKFFQESVLVEQAFVMDPDQTVARFIETSAKELGQAITLKGFIKYEVGEGIEKEEADFAAEVAAFSKQ